MITQEKLDWKDDKGLLEIGQYELISVLIDISESLREIKFKLENMNYNMATAVDMIPRL